MDNNIKTLMVAGVVASAFLAPTLGKTIPQLIRFSAGDPVGATDFNSNFTTLRTAVQNLEDQVAALQAEVAATRSTAGRITLPNGESIEVRRKLLVGTKSATTVTLPHGIPNNPATQRRFLGCEIIGDGLDVQAINLAGQLGSQAANWCEFSDTELELTWVTAGTVTFQVIVDYTEVPFR